MFHYSVGQHDVATMEKSLLDCGANVICGDNMQVREESESFDNVSGLAGRKVSQLRIATA
jgi:hypothetical protein